ncbi:IS110 family transposase [Deferribacter autotrophicus]|uniref:IS110 family transposase n=1 Tax=Deferribacter autotrophicus TaxID=500465 RepID=A0A5A8F1B9_9BACT|nr:transposase [Deferribacter autotrophicus]KAA0257181.1 IS110 family transposase [Deferribacter autotrophicus]
MKNDKFAFFIGVDVSKDKFNLAIVNNKLELLKETEFQMDIEGFNSFYDLIKKYNSSVIALESTGSYHINLLAFLVSKKKDVCLINPALIKKFAQSVTLRKTKTDKIDAVIIAKFIAKNIEHFNYFVLPESNDIIALARMKENIAQ